MIKKIFLKSIALFLLLFVLNFIYKQWFFASDIEEHAGVLNKFKNLPLQTDILYLGESSNVTVGNNDADTRSISELIGAHFPSLITADITYPASHAEVYKNMLKYLPNNFTTKTVIVTVNLRSFGANWIYSDLETSIQKSLLFLQKTPPFYNRFLLSFKAYDIKSAQERNQQMFDKWRNDTLYFPYAFPYKNVIEWDSTLAYTGLKDSLGNYDQASTELACHFVKNFAFQIDTNQHPRMNDFNNIVKIAKKHRWNLVFNLLAENTQKAEELVGQDLIFLMQQNAKLLEEYYGAKGVLVVNNLNSVADENFIDKTWPTEHYDEVGRKRIAQNVAERLKKEYAKELQ